MEVINIDKYLKQHKILVKPEHLISFIIRFNKNKEAMVQKVAIKQDGECKYCKDLEKITQGRSKYCKKHKAVFEFQKIDLDNTAIGSFNGLKIHLFNRYALVEMKTDPNGVYLVWIGEDENTDSVYCLSKEYFPECFERGMSIDELFQPESILMYKNTQIYWEENNPRVENIK